MKEKKCCDERYDELAEEFQPERIKYVLIGESPPYDRHGTLRYFYNKDTETSSLLVNVSLAFLGYNPRLDDTKKKEVLDQLKSKQVFLIDSVNYPINKRKNNESRTVCDKRRQKIIRDCYPFLRKKIKNLPLEKGVKIFIIHNNVNTAIGKQLKKDFEDFKKRVSSIGFPRRRIFIDDLFIKKIKKNLECIGSTI